MLLQASKLQAFVQQQNERTGKSSAKKEWLLAAQELQEERCEAPAHVGTVPARAAGCTTALHAFSICREAAERELHAALLATHSHACQDMNSDTQGVLTSWQHMVASTAQLRQDLRDQVRERVRSVPVRASPWLARGTVMRGQRCSLLLVLRRSRQSRLCTQA